MRKWIMPLTIVLVLIAACAYAFEREQMSIGELTSSKIKNTSGTTVLDVGAGTFRGTGKVSGSTGAFTNVSGATYGAVHATTIAVGGVTFTKYSSSTTGVILKH